MERIVYLDRDAIRAPIRCPNFAHEWIEYPNSTPEQVFERLNGATIALTNKVRISGEVLAKLPSLKFICVTATGTDCVDLGTCRQLGIKVSNVRNWCSTSVAEHVFALIFALRRSLVSSRAQVLHGDWQCSLNYCVYPEYFPMELSESTLGIIGCGALGKKVAEIGTALGMKLLIAEHKGVLNPREKRIPFEQVIAESDVVTLHCPLNPQTKHLIGLGELQKMKPHALLINCARGGLVDAQALADAIQVGTIAGAGIDVLEVEPPPDANPLLRVNLPHLIVTPHVAWLSTKSLEVMTHQITQNLEMFWAGPQQNVVV